MTLSSLSNMAAQAKKKMEACQNVQELQGIKQHYLGKKGALSRVFLNFQDLSIEEKRRQGKLVHEISLEIEEAHQSALSKLKERKLAERLAKEDYDLLRPLETWEGALHPITQMQYEVEDIFSNMGFAIVDGPEIESDEYNFERLNFSLDHPARDMQDSIWTKDAYLLRTHTSAVQVRVMEERRPPMRIIAPGRCFRYEERDASHENTFHQVEGMMIDHDISVANLIYVMKSFLSVIFARELKVRLRPGYFPFVEPGFELDIACLICQGQGCQTCRQSGWVELLPCGLIHPKVLASGSIDPGKWSGFAFGLGLDRLVMMRYGIEDIRHFLSGNLRFLEQF